jgi:hypothetical protein
MTDKWKALERLRMRAAGGNHADEDCNIINLAFRALEAELEHFGRFKLFLETMGGIDVEYAWNETAVATRTGSEARGERQ